MELTREQQKRLKIKRYASFVIVSAAYLLVQFHRNTTGVIRNELAETFAMSATGFGTLSAMYFYPYMLAQIPMGALLDTIGVKRTVCVGSLVAALGSLVFGLSGSFGMACAGRLLIGVGVSVPVVCMQKLIASWFPESRVASWFGTSSVIGQSGGLIAQYPLAFAIDHVSWRVIFMVCCGVSLAVALLCRRFVENGPEYCGLPSMARLEGRPEPPRPKRLTARDIFRAIGRTFANRYIWPVFIVMAVHQGLYSMFTSTWAIPYLRESFGFSNTEATGFTTGLMLGAIVFSFFVGKISDRLKSRKIVIAGISVIILALWCVFCFTATGGLPVWLLWASMILMGVGGCGVQIMFAYSREMNDPAFVGISVSTVNVTGMLASAVMPTLLGALLDRYALEASGGALYQKAFIPCIVMAAVAVVFSLLIRDSGCRNRYYDLIAKQEK